MATTQPIRDRIQVLKREYDTLHQGKVSLLSMIDEVEIAESVYNSNAIENSTLTLEETERILLEQMLSRNVSVREVFEAKNLARVMEFKRTRVEDSELNNDLILRLHQMLIGGIDDAIAGRFRRQGEYVRVGTHIAPVPERVERMMDNILIEYSSNLGSYFSGQDCPISPGFRDHSSLLRRQWSLGAGYHQFSTLPGRSTAYYHTQLGEGEVLSGFQGL